MRILKTQAAKSREIKLKLISEIKATKSDETECKCLDIQATESAKFNVYI